MHHVINVDYKTQGLQAWTIGLGGLPHPELRVWVKEPKLLTESENYLRTVVAYILQKNTFIQPGHTLNYGYWLTKLQQAHDGFLEVWEYNAEATEFVFGATLTLTYWQQQHELCNRVGAEFNPPNPEQAAAISAGVLEEEMVGGARFPSPQHMSGWWITSDRYNGDVSTLTVQHLYHVTAARPDLARYLALPYGFRFVQDKDRDYVWFDKEILTTT